MIDYGTIFTSVRNRAVVGGVPHFLLLITSYVVGSVYVIPAGIIPLCAALDVIITRPRRLPFLIAMQGHAYMVCHCLRSRFYRRELSSEFEASSISRYPSITPSIKRG